MDRLTADRGGDIKIKLDVILGSPFFWDLFSVLQQACVEGRREGEEKGRGEGRRKGGEGVN